MFTRSGRIEEARDQLETLIECVKPLGLVLEGLNAADGFYLVNYPQAFSYIGLINSALYISAAQGKGLLSPPRWVSVSEIQRESTDRVTAFYL